MKDGEQALAELRAAVVAVVTEPADNLCWIDVYRRLGALVGLEFDPVRIPPDQMKAQCSRFVDSIHSGKPYVTDEATAEIVRLQGKLAKIDVMARRHNHPGVNTGAQTLAAAIVRIIEEKL